MDDSQVVRGRGGSQLSPISFRASEPLRDKLDELARRQHRTRGNLIQHILWTYIHDRESKQS